MADRTMLADAALQMGLVQQLMLHGANVSACNNAGVPPLEFACDMGRVDIVELLCEKGASPLQVTR